MSNHISRSAKKFFSMFIFLVVAMLLISQYASGKAVTVRNGALVYSPVPSQTFDQAGTTYARIITLKHNGPNNGTLLVTFDQLVEVNGRQVYPIYRSTDDGATWTLVANITDDRFNTTRTSQPTLFEVPQQVGNLAPGTILLAGNIFPEDKSSSRIVIYKSTDRGSTWSFLSTVDIGGPVLYDPTSVSTTSTIWEPFLSLDSSGNLVVYYSDERQKSNNILQALVLRKSTDGGQTWGPVVNVVAIPNRNDRPGMITVIKLPNGKYMATYEIVNRPNQTFKSAPVYFKFSDDGVTWNASDLGTPIKLSDGRGIGSSPYAKWVPIGGSNGAIIVAAKWGLNNLGHVSGGQNFFINYNLGQGTWERLPMAVTYDAVDYVGYFPGYSQSIDTSVDGLTLFQATNVENPTTRRNDIRVGTIPLKANRYEAEKATLNHVQVGTVIDGSNGQEVQFINYPDSYVKFTKIKAPSSGTYTVNVRYSNGTERNSTHKVEVNNRQGFTLHYPPTANWDRYLWVSFTTNLKAGDNTIQFSYDTGNADIDVIDVYKSGK